MQFKRKVTPSDREKVSTIQGCPLYRGVHYAEVQCEGVRVRVGAGEGEGEDENVRVKVMLY